MSENQNPVYGRVINPADGTSLANLRSMEAVEEFEASTIWPVVRTDAAESATKED